jgi:hypothetical protein
VGKDLDRGFFKELFNHKCISNLQQRKPPLSAKLTSPPAENILHDFAFFRAIFRKKLHGISRFLAIFYFSMNFLSLTTFL